MGLADDLLKASKFDPAVFYKPSPEPIKVKVKVKEAMCFNGCDAVRMKGLSYCRSCHAERKRDYRKRVREGGEIRAYRSNFNKEK
jgi:hypothetical protein